MQAADMPNVLSGPPPARERAVAAFAASYGQPPAFLVRCPGRVNLIGEHTDYNDGFVLPMAIPHSTWVAATPRGDGRVEAISEGYRKASFSLSERPSTRRRGWDRYVRAMGWSLADDDVPLVGWTGAVASDIPIGASLSSSAALEIASGLTFLTAAEASRDPVQLARLAQRAETNFVGVPVGIMDQLICATARDGHATLIDCADLSRKHHPLPPGLTVLVLDSMTRRSLANSGYADRRAACARVARALGVPSLREVDRDALDAGGGALDPTDYRRARHVVDEIARTVDAAGALVRGDGAVFGELMNESHASLRDLFEVSSPALDALAGAARAADGCLGARLTGGGFAGCCVALVRSTSLDETIAEIRDRDRAGGGEPAQIHVCHPSPGASVEEYSSLSDERV